MGVASEAHATGWTQPQGDFYLKVWNRSLIGDTVFGASGDNLRLTENFQDHQINVYGEYGLTDDLTLTLSSAPVGFASYAGANQAYFGGATAGARYQLYNGPVVLAASADFGVRPTSVDPLGTEVVNGETVIITPVIGTVHGSVSFGAGIPLSFGWVSLATGARFFSNGDLKPAFYAGGQFGWDTTIGLIVDLHVNWYNALGDLPPVQGLGAGQTRYLGFGLGLSWWFLDNVAITAGFDGALFANANAATPALTLGFEFR